MSKGLHFFLFFGRWTRKGDVTFFSPVVKFASSLSAEIVAEFAKKLWWCCWLWSKIFELLRRLHLLRLYQRKSGSCRREKRKRRHLIMEDLERKEADAVSLTMAVEISFNRPAKAFLSYDRILEAARKFYKNIDMKRFCARKRVLGLPLLRRVKDDVKRSLLPVQAPSIHRLIWTSRATENVFCC